MPWPVRSRLLCRNTASLPGGAVTILGTVPAGKTWLVKEIAIWNSTAGSGSCNFGDVIAGSHANAEKISPIAASDFALRVGRNWVLPSGYGLYVVPSATGVWQIHISGAELG